MWCMDMDSLKGYGRTAERQAALLWHASKQLAAAHGQVKDTEGNGGIESREHTGWLETLKGTEDSPVSKREITCRLLGHPALSSGAKQDHAIQEAALNPHYKQKEKASPHGQGQRCGLEYKGKKKTICLRQKIRVSLSAITLLSSVFSSNQATET